MKDRVSIDLKDGVADVRLIRADKMNALDPAMFEGIIEAGDRLAKMKGLRCVVLSGLPPMHAFPALPQPLRTYIGSRAKRLDAVLARLMAGAADGFHFPLAIGLNSTSPMPSPRRK